MLAVERRQKILDLVYRHKTVQVTDLSKSFGVTEETIRRDLQTLDGSGLLSRTHGGAVAREAEAEDLPYRMRQITNIEAKRKIAALAAAFPRTWKETRDHMPLETSVPGVFAAGDVRAGAMNRVASAVGEGAMAVRLVADYLART